jgi:hypothetical protein
MHRLFGLHETLQEEVQDISGEDSKAYHTVQQQKARAYKRLHEALSAVVPLRENVAEGTTSRAAKLTLTEQQRRRLDAAYQHIQSTGAKVTGDALRKSTGLSSYHASAYLLNLGQTVRAGRTALTDEETERRRATQGRRQWQRLEVAYAAMEAEGQTITQRSLSKTAHIGDKYTAAFLQAKRNNHASSNHARQEEVQA